MVASNRSNIGDDLLKVVSIGFRGALYETSIPVARTGDDEVAVMAEGVNSSAAAARRIQTFRDVLVGPERLSGNLVDMRYRDRRFIRRRHDAD